MLLPFLAASALVAPSIVSAASSIGLPPSLPKYSKPLNKDFLGLSIEMDRWTSWAGDAVGKPNVYVNQVLSNLASLTGTAVPLRVGANSEDHGVLELNQEVANVTFPESTPLVPYPEAEHIGIGRDFYALSQNLPEGTAFTWGINLRVNNETETVGQAALLYDTFYGSKKQNLSKVSLNLIEIGNEIDFYNNPRLKRSYPGYDIFAYTKQWADFGGKVVDLFAKERNPPKLQIGAFVDIPAAFLWTVSATLGTGVQETKAGKNLGNFAFHNYQGVFANNATVDAKSGALMDRANTRSSIARHAQSARQSNEVGLEYVLGEANSYANHGVPGVSNSAEAALWLLDFSLMAAANGVARMFLHEGIGFEYNLIQPVPVQGKSTRPKIQAPYYGAVMVNEAIGTGKDTRVVELPSNSSNLAAYGIWEGDRLARVAVINSQLYLSGMKNRTAETVNIQGYAGGKTASIKRFTPPSANATEGLYWGGVSYEAAGGKPTGQVVEQWLNGTSFDMQPTEAVLICFK